MDTLAMEVETVPMEVPEWKPEMHESCSRYWNEVEVGMRRFEEELEAELDKQKELEASEVQQEQETERCNRAFGGEGKHEDVESDEESEEKHEDVPEEVEIDDEKKNEHMNDDGYCSCQSTESDMSDNEAASSGKSAASAGLDGEVGPHVSCMHFLKIVFSMHVQVVSQVCKICI